MTILHNRLYCICIILMLLSCTTSRKKVVTDENLKKYNGITWAKGFEIFIAEGYKILNVSNPWIKNETLASYLILYDTTLSVKKLPKTDFVITPGVQKVVCMSTVYYSMLKLLKAENLVTGITDVDYIYDSSVFSRIDKKELIDFGSSFQPGIETIINHDPDLIFKYLYVTQDRSDDVLSYAGIPVVYLEGFAEQHPLGRAEWIKFIAAFIGKEKEADSIFAEIERSYLEVKKQVSNAGEKPMVLTGYNNKGSWATWGSGNYLAQLIRDAGGQYFWQDDTTSGLLQVSFEIIYDRFNNADFWLSPGACSLAELKRKDDHHMDFDVVKRKQIYSFCKRQNKNGGLDYYESGAVRPDIVLKDIASILHPGLFESYNRVYWEQLK